MSTAPYQQHREQFACSHHLTTKNGRLGKVITEDRTPNLRDWNPTRYHCAMRSAYGRNPFQRNYVNVKNEANELRAKRMLYP